MIEVPNIPVTLVGQPVEGIRPIKWADARESYQDLADHLAIFLRKAKRRPEAAN